MQPAWQATRLLYSRQEVHNRVRAGGRQIDLPSRYLVTVLDKQFQTLGNGELVMSMATPGQHRTWIFGTSLRAAAAGLVSAIMFVLMLGATDAVQAQTF